jgi:MYXO-CTERM domain-containing protein
VTVSGETDSTYTVSGLEDKVTYNFVIAAVDNSGNIGPPSTENCATPAPINDFWKIYREDGGQAGGGFCALEAAGAPAGSTIAFAGAGAFVLAAVRRRRRTKR